MRYFLIIIILLFATSSRAVATEWQNSAEVATLFTKDGVSGTFVLYDVKADKFIGYNSPRAHAQFVPASTYKIVNSLIGLFVGAVKSVDEVLPYGGKPQPFKVWEKDMSLREAIKVSNVPIYQELARRIGLANMRAQLAKLNYGNGQIGELVDRFWLDGPLKISAIEQTVFLARLAQRQLPFSEEVQAQVREIIMLEQTEHWTLFGKTGTATVYDPALGWWVGWVEKDGNIYAFALNIDLSEGINSEQRMILGKNALKLLGVL